MTSITEKLTVALGDRYRIERELGEGGMATVYLAEDLKHERKVALKVLKPELAAVLGADRFVQEIKTTASLQHPHILPLFDSGEADGFLYYVMPYIEGETLRDKLDRETQLGIDEAVRITTEVADALDYAHRNGVIHRDIKPENILLHDGRPMVADFGIALAVSAAAGGRMTETGLSLGTPHYMSPEQATAEKEITNRSDVYSLACVTYEMLAGDPPHTGSTAQQIIMKIVTEEATAVTNLRKSVPPNVAAALAKALEKLPADRFEGAGDFAQALETPSFRHGLESASRAAAAPERRHDPRLLALAAAFLIMTGIAAWGLLRPAPPRPVARYHIVLPEDQRIGGVFARVALTPDGSRLVYSRGAGIGTPTGIRVRQRDQLETTPLAGTTGAFAPFVSPDGGRVGFLAGGEVKVVSLRGGPPVTITDTLVGGAGATWGPDGYIYSDARGPNPLVKVSAAGGTPEWFTRLDSAGGETDHLFPVALPNGRGVLFRVGYTTSQNETDIAVAETATGEHRILVRGVYAVYARSGHLVYVTADGTLLAAPFDQDAMELTGEPTALISDVGLRVISTPDLAIADDGTLVYTIGGTVDAGGEPVWVSRDGGAEPVAPSWTRTAFAPALSPDASQLAVTIGDEGTNDIWVRDLGRGTASKLTFEGDNMRSVWTPDGTALAFISDRGGQLDAYLRRADGTAQAELLLDRPGVVQQARYSRDGTWLVYREGGGAASDLYARRLDGDTVTITLAATEFQETAPVLSPDGRWLAYTSNETDQPEVYVRPFPDVSEGKWLVSRGGGTEPLWSPDGRELFYRNGADELVTVEVLPNTAPPTGRQQILFSTGEYMSDIFHQTYDVTPDGQRFVMMRSRGAETNDLQLIVVQNFFQVLEQEVGR